MGILGNFMILSIFSMDRQYRTTPGTFYFLIGSVHDMLVILIVLGSRLMTFGFNIDLNRISVVWYTRDKNNSSDGFNSGDHKLLSENSNICSEFNLNVVDCTADSMLSPNDSKSSIIDKPISRKDQNEDNDSNQNASLSSSKGDVTSQNSNINDSDESGRSTTFRNSSARAAFNTSGRMNRGKS
ncbi:unnamed protein product [Rotaria sp. Silwood2]|nr:unnamed protein product [Rotaria sp. Silwood2]